jgi:hypothetical protein
MRARVIKAVIAAVDRGDFEGDAQPTEVTRLAADLEYRIRDVVEGFLREHAFEIKPSGEVCRLLGPHSVRTVALQALVAAAAFESMVLVDMDPDDFAELARAVARLSIPEVNEERERLRRTGMA